MLDNLMTPGMLILLQAVPGAMKQAAARAA